jgi:hypothetical protein
MIQRNYQQVKIIDFIEFISVYILSNITSWVLSPRIFYKDSNAIVRSNVQVLNNGF